MEWNDPELTSENEIIHGLPSCQFQIFNSDEVNFLKTCIGYYRID